MPAAWPGRPGIPRERGRWAAAQGQHGAARARQHAQAAEAMQRQQARQGGQHLAADPELTDFDPRRRMVQGVEQQRIVAAL
ncbi:hypothetical protein DVK02_17765, partial [Halobellus sp. Atlit-31R]